MLALRNTKERHCMAMVMRINNDDKDDDGDDEEDYDDWQVVVTLSNLFGFMLQSCGKHLIPSSASFHHIPWFI